MTWPRELDDIDFVQFAVCDINTIPRGRAVPKKFAKKVAEEGLEIWNGAVLISPAGGLAMSVTSTTTTFSNHVMRPCPATLTPVPWASRKGHRLGNVLCDLHFKDGSPDTSDPRQLLKKQVALLRERHGLEVRSAFEYEFYALKQRGTADGGTEFDPYGSLQPMFQDLRVWQSHNQVMVELHECLSKMGVDLTQMHPEFPPGQWEVTTEPQAGVRAGDVGFYVKNAVKGVFSLHGIQATFMTRPQLEQIASGLHLNHSLWRVGEQAAGKDGSVASQEKDEGEKRAQKKKKGKKEEEDHEDEKEEEERGVNAFLDPSSEDLLSDTARHWLAGLLAHGRALSAVCSPTLNCYRRLHGSFVPGLTTWGLDDRTAMIRARTSRANVFFENRLVSSAANPYLALAVTIAAGTDGLNRKLQCPGPMDKERAQKLPTSLPEALDALESDVELRALLGDHFVTSYVTAKREYEVKAMEDAGLTTEEEKIQFERKLYMQGL